METQFLAYLLICLLPYFSREVIIIYIIYLKILASEGTVM